MPEGFYKRLFDAGFILLVLTLTTIFILPTLPLAVLKFAYPLFFSGIFVMSALSLEKRRKQHFTTALVLTAVLLLTVFTDLLWLRLTSRILQLLYFLFIVIALVKQIASTEKANKQVIVNSIAAYFLLGFACTILVVIVDFAIPGAYTFAAQDMGDPSKFATMGEITYYTFITYTTTGYGDLVPLLPISRSLAILIASSGQLYIAIIIAMLVGKYASSRK